MMGIAPACRDCCSAVRWLRSSSAKTASTTTKVRMFLVRADSTVWAMAPARKVGAPRPSPHEPRSRLEAHTHRSDGGMASSRDESRASALAVSAIANGHRLRIGAGHRVTFILVIGDGARLTGRAIGTMTNGFSALNLVIIEFAIGVGVYPKGDNHPAVGARI